MQTNNSQRTNIFLIQNVPGPLRDYTEQLQEKIRLASVPEAVDALSPEDIQELKTRVRETNHPDVKNESGALFLFGTNKRVNQMNNKRLKALKEKEIIIPAITLQKTIKNFYNLLQSDLYQ